MGENTTDDLQSREDALAEMLAAEDGGFGYSVNSSNPLTDIDLQPDDSSSQFTDSGTGTQDYTDQFGDNEDDENETEQSNKGSKNSGEDDDNYNDDYDEETPDNFDGGVEEEKEEATENGAEDNDNNELDENGIGEEKKDIDGKKTEIKGQKKGKFDGPIKWKPGDKITLSLLSQVWNECRGIKKLRSLMDAANKGVEAVINTMGPNLMIRLNNYISKTTDNDIDTIGSLLELVSKNGKRLTYTALSAIEALVDQQWTQTILLASLPSAFNAAILEPRVKAILNAIFTIAVPLINAKSNKTNNK